jgi:CheY-like chemotaxis protein
MHVAAAIFRLDCLSCAVTSNVCVSCGALIRVPAEISAAHHVCEARPSAREEDVPMPQQRKKVLIVDNDEDVLIALERVLEEQGYETTTAWDLPEGLGLMATTGFDLLLIGDHPPELNCERVLKLLRRENVNVPCLVMHTAARHPFSEQYLRYLGASGVACKWSEEEVMLEVSRCMAPMPMAQPKTMAAAAGRAG